MPSRIIKQSVINFSIAAKMLQSSDSQPWFTGPHILYKTFLKIVICTVPNDARDV